MINTIQNTNKIAILATYFPKNLPKTTKKKTTADFYFKVWLRYGTVHFISTSLSYQNLFPSYFPRVKRNGCFKSVPTRFKKTSVF